MDTSELNLNLDNLKLNDNKSSTKLENEEDSVRNYVDVYVLSESGKPIYCYSKRDDEATLLPLCQALINYYGNTQNDTLKYVLLKSGLKITFSVKSPVIIIVVNHQFSGLDSNLIVNQLYAQIISTVTNKTLKSVYEQSAKFDLRRLLGNSERMIDYLIENGLVAKQLENLTNRLFNKRLSDRQDDRLSENSTTIIDNLSSENSFKSNESDEIFCFLTSVIQPFSSSVRQNALASSNLTSNVFKPHLNRVMIPILPLNQTNRDSITNILTSSIASSSNDILYNILIKFDNDTVEDEEESNRSMNTVEQSNVTQQSTSENQTNSELPNEVNKVTVIQENDETQSNTRVEEGSSELESSIEQSMLESDELLMKEELKPTAKCHLITIANQNSKITKLNALDAHIVINLMLVLKNQLTTVESLWLPVCLPRFNNNAFMHAHFCLLNLPISEDRQTKNRFGLIQLTTKKEDFDKCQLAKNIISERLSKLTIQTSTFSEISIPILHAFWYQSLRSQTLVFKSKYCQNKILCRNDYLIHYMAKRMIDSNLKTFWMRSDRHYIALLGWHSPTFQLYIQFDVIASKSFALTAAQTIIKWIKKEEDKILIKDYQ